MNPLSDTLLVTASTDLSRLARGDQQLAARVVGESLLEPGVTYAPLTAEQLRERLASAGATAQTGALSDVQPLAVLGREPRNERERAVLSVLLAWHLRALNERASRATVEALLPALDALELGSPYAPYTAMRAVLSVKERTALTAVLAGASAGSERARAALRTLRELGVEDDTRTLEQAMDPALLAGETDRDGPTAPTLAGELEGSYRDPFVRLMNVFTGFGLVRGVVLWLARRVFSYRRPITVTLERNVLRVVGHTELLGRTLNKVDTRLPLAELVELRRESRYPALPAVLGVFGLGLGALFGARSVVEGAGVSYFPLIALGFGFILGGLLFEFVLRALFPGVHGRVRLLVRTRGGLNVELTGLDGAELDQLLKQAERHVGSAR